MVYARKLKDGFAEYALELAPQVLKLISYFDEGVRAAAALAAPQFLAAVAAHPELSAHAGGGSTESTSPLASRR